MIRDYETLGPKDKEWFNGVIENGVRTGGAVFFPGDYVKDVDIVTTERPAGFLSKIFAEYPNQGPAEVESFMCGNFKIRANGTLYDIILAPNNHAEAAWQRATDVMCKLLSEPCFKEMCRYKPFRVAVFQGLKNQAVVEMGFVGQETATGKLLKGFV